MRKKQPGEFKLKSIIYIFTLLIIISSNLSAQAEKPFQTLDYQIRNSIEDEGRRKADSNLKDYLKNMNGDVKKGMKLLLLEDIFSKYKKITAKTFKIDGYDSEWTGIPDIRTDKKNDVTPKAADLIEFKCYLDKDYNLYVMNKTLARPYKNKKKTAFLVYIEVGKNRLYIYYNWPSKNWHTFYTQYIGKKKIGKSIKLDINYSVNRIGEACIPLGEIFDEAGLKRTNRIFVRGGAYYRNRKKRYDISKSLEIFQRPKNYALTLLLHLMKNKCYARGDSMPIALSLANNYLYSIADSSTRKAIKKDIVKHYRLYQKILKWQKISGLKYDLSKVPVIAKIFWANRYRKLDRKKVLTLKYYREFIDNVENLYKVHKTVQKLDKPGRGSLSGYCSKLERYVKSHNTYRTSMKSFRIQYARRPNMKKLYQTALAEYKRGLYYRYYFGKKRAWHHFGWLNYQLPRMKKTGKYIGDCGTVTTMQMAFYRGAGIPPVSFQYRPIPNYKAGHNFPGYYDIYLQKWQTVQKPGFEDMPLYFYFKKPVLHHKIYKLKYSKKGKKIYHTYYQGEKTTTKGLVKFFKRGFFMPHFEKVFLSDKTHRPGFIFNNISLPKGSIDWDNDGICNSDEIRLGLNPRSIDSDNDGYSDLWEIERGFKANDRFSPTDKSILAIDGLAQKFLQQKSTKLSGIMTVFDKKADYKAKKQIFDIKSISVGIFHKNLYLATTYHNDVSKNTLNNHAFMITLKGRRSPVKQYWIRWYKKSPRVYVRIRKRGKKTKYKKIKTIGLVGSVKKDGEFLIPLSYFKGTEVLFIRYYAGGMLNGKRINADKSKILRISLKNKNSDKILSTIRKNAQSIDDPKGDTELRKNKYDIKKVTYSIMKNKLYIIVKYYKNIKLADFILHTVDLKEHGDGGRKRRWLFQWYNPNSCNLHYYVNRKKRRKVYLDINNFDCIRLKNGYVFVLDTKLFALKDNLKIRYRAGGYKRNGKRTSSADKTPYIWLETN